MPTEFFLRSRRVITSEGARAAMIHVKDGVIVEVIEHEQASHDYPLEDVGDLIVMPGLVDIHVHLNEPGRAEWEGFETGTRAAAAGGVTTLVDMPLNSTPVTTTVTALQEKRKAASKKLWVDCGFHAGLIPGNHHELEALIQAGVLGVKTFWVHSGIDDFPNATEADLRVAMPIIAKHGLPLLVHAEIASPIHNDKSALDPRSYQAYLASRPQSWELEAIALMVKLCREYDCRAHVVHLSSAAALPMLRQARAEGLPLTIETCPHYLFFAAEEIPDGDTRFKCAPPIREAANREQLWAALKEGVIDFIASDHSPCPPEMKRLAEGDFQHAWGGIASLQFTLPVMWTAARLRGFSLFDLSEWLCRRPAELVGLKGRKGAIAHGYDADFVVWSPEASFTLEASMIHHRHKLTPYAGRKLFGVVDKTFLRGEKVYESGNFLAEPPGKILVRFDAQAP